MPPYSNDGILRTALAKAVGPARMSRYATSMKKRTRTADLVREKGVRSSLCP